MVSKDNDRFENEEPGSGEGWEDFRGDDVEPIGIAQLKDMSLPSMPEDIRIWVMDDYFPETTISREGDILVCEIQEHLEEFGDRVLYLHELPRLLKLFSLFPTLTQEIDLFYPCW